MKSLIQQSGILFLLAGVLTLGLSVESETTANLPYVMGGILMVIGLLAYIILNRIL